MKKEKIKSDSTNLENVRVFDDIGGVRSSDRASILAPSKQNIF